ncbi:MAG: phosphotransferase family protein [Novosphingobium sp.]|nr:phosphotransferase family protein [Novosphingobium sp.]
MSDVIVAPRVRDFDELADALTKWLQGKMPDATGITVGNFSYPRGAGRSHETILFDARWTEVDAPVSMGCVVRIKPTAFKIYPDDLFEQQFRVMQVLHEHSAVRVPRPLWIEHDPGLLGAPFFVMEKVIGRVAVSYPPYAQTGWVAEASPQRRRHMWESGVRQLAEMQRVPLDKLRFLEGPPHAREGLEQEFDKYSRFVDWIEEQRPWPVIRAGLARLKELWPDNRPPGLVWGDARIGNMMFDENFEVVAVVDWEQPSLGGALNDLGWWLVSAELMHGANDTRPHLEGMGTRQETIDLWEKVSGKSAANVEWYEDFTRLKMSCLSISMAYLDSERMPDEAELAKRLKLA